MCSKAKSAKLRWMRRTGFSTLIEPCMMYDTCLQRRRFNSSALTAYGSISRPSKRYVMEPPTIRSGG